MDYLARNIYINIILKIDSRGCIQKLFTGLIFTGLIFLSISSVWPQADAAAIPSSDNTEHIDSGRTAWMLVSTALVLLMVQTGDGKIFVVPLEQCIRISDGKKGKDAI